MFNIAFFSSGLGSIADTLIQAIEKKIIPNARSVCIISDQDSKSLKLSTKHGLESYWVDYRQFGSRSQFSDQILGHLLDHQVDYGFFTFDRLLSGKILDIYRNKLINLHPSLLPSFQGVRPLQKSIDYGCPVIGATCHFIDESTDGGPIINQCILPINSTNDVRQIEHALFPLRQQIALESLYALVNGWVRVEGRRVFLQNSDSDALPVNPKIRGLEVPDWSQFHLEQPDY